MRFLGKVVASLKEVYQDGKVLPRLLNGETPKYLYRIMSEDEYQAGIEKGKFYPFSGTALERGRTHASLKPDFRYANYKNNILVKIIYTDEDGWKAKHTGAEVVAVTDQPIPAKRVIKLAQGSATTLRKVQANLEYKVTDMGMPIGDKILDPKKHDFIVRAFTNGKLVGEASFSHRGIHIYPYSSKVTKESQGQGIATGIYLYARKISDKPIKPEGPDSQTDDSQALWKKSGHLFN